MLGFQFLNIRLNRSARVRHPMLLLNIDRLHGWMKSFKDINGKPTMTSYERIPNSYGSRGYYAHLNFPEFAECGSETFARPVETAVEVADLDSLI